MENNDHVKARQLMLSDGTGVAAAPRLSRTPGYGQQDVEQQVGPVLVTMLN